MLTPTLTLIPTTGFRYAAHYRYKRVLLERLKRAGKAAVLRRGVGAVLREE